MQHEQHIHEQDAHGQRTGFQLEAFRPDMAQPLAPKGEAHGVRQGGCSCGCGHSAPVRLSAEDIASFGEASATKAIYRIINMDCPMEEALIRKRLASVPGIRGLEFNLMQRVLTVHHELPDTAAIEEALRSIDMAPEALASLHGASAPLDAPAVPWAKLAAAGVLAALSEACHFAWEAGVFEAAGFFSIMGFLPFLFALSAILLSGVATYRKGWLAVRNGDLNINALMSVAVTGAVLIGQFPEAAMVMVLFNVSEAIEARALDRARKAVSDLLALAPETASVRQPDGSWAETDIRAIPLGSRVRVRPGERIALDGIILEGHSAVDQSPITGESLPVDKAAGDAVFAGTVNTSGSFDFEVTAGASDTTLARIIHAVEQAQGSRAPIQRFVDSFARWYTPAVFLASLLTAALPPLFFGAGWLGSIYTALVILVIGCPCALVISTPVTIASGLAAATRSGILIKGGIYLEQGRLLKRLALDKTGTITHGRPRLTDIVLPNGLPAADGSEDVQRSVRKGFSLAARSDHPVSCALAEHAAAMGAQAEDVADFQAVAGQGVRGVLEGSLWHLGNRCMMQGLGLDSPELARTAAELEASGRTVAMLAGEGRVHVLFAVADTIRESSVEAVRELKELGVETVMLTGDAEPAARAIAAQAGVDSFRAGLLPEDKLAAVEGLMQGGVKTGMAGDGINDAPALARADIGFAMAGGGTDTAMETADVALMDDDLRKIPRFIRLSRAVYAILVQNIVLALGVKALFFGLTFTGHATMWMAVFADVGTALMVVANGLRAARK